MEALIQTQEDPHLGNYRYKILFLVCDIPANAAALNMNQFNGCTHCLLIGLKATLYSKFDRRLVEQTEQKFRCVSDCLKEKKRVTVIAGPFL